MSKTLEQADETSQSCCEYVAVDEKTANLEKKAESSSGLSYDNETPAYFETQREDALDCLICAYPYDRHQKVPRILQCGHTFCQTCLFELKRQRGDGHTTILCPTCRKVETVFCIENLPENEYVFEREANALGMNVFSPYEAAKRLMIESKSLMMTGERYHQFLRSMEDVDREYEKNITENYE